MKEYYVESVCTDGNRSSRETPYDYLAAAIVKQAAKDYVRVTGKLWRKNIKIVQRRNLLLEKVELTEFFCSEWYEQLTDIDSEKLIARCKVIAREQEKQAIKNRNRASIQKMLKKQGGQQGSQEQEGQQEIQSQCVAEATGVVEGGQNT